MCDEIINTTNIASTNIPKNITNTISTIDTSTEPINYIDKKVRYELDYYILHNFSLVTISLFMFAKICFHYTKYKAKQKILTH